MHAVHHVGSMCVAGFHSLPQIGPLVPGEHAQNAEMVSTLFGMFPPIGSRDQCALMEFPGRTRKHVHSGLPFVHAEVSRAAMLVPGNSLVGDASTLFGMFYEIVYWWSWCNQGFHH